jgi:hypothetical protein
MVLSKAKAGAALVLMLAVNGTGVGVLAAAGELKNDVPRRPPAAEGPRDGARARPGLPAAWAGRWVADPFAGATEVEVKHFSKTGGAPHTYHLKDPMVVAQVVKAARITAIQNGVFTGCIPSARVTVRHRDADPFNVSFTGDCTLSCDFGTFRLDEGFFDALDRAVSDDAKRSVRLREFLPDVPANNPWPPAGKPTARSLASGFTSLEVTYLLDGRLHTTQVGDEKTLDALHRALTVLITGKVTAERAQSRNMRVVCKDRAGFYFQVENATTVYDFNVGKFTLAPAFFEALNKEVSRRASCAIDVTADNNALPEKLRPKADDFRRQLADVTAMRRTVQRDGKEEAIAVTDPKEIAGILENLRWAEAPAHDLKLPNRDRAVELTLKGGKKVTLTYLNPGTNCQDATLAAAVPVLGDLVEVSGRGQLWIDNQFQGRFDNVRFERECRAKEARAAATSRLVCRDLPAFLKLVVSVGAQYADERDAQVMGCLTDDRARAVIDLLAGGTFERLDWDDRRWEEELSGLDERKAGGLDLAPGLGFSLPVVVRGAKEMLIPGCGRLTFADSPLAKLQKAIDPEKPDTVKLLPRPKARE